MPILQVRQLRLRGLGTLPKVVQLVSEKAEDSKPTLLTSGLHCPTVPPRCLAQLGAWHTRIGSPLVT